MPANLSALLDTLLVVAGLVLVATGLVMFIRSKSSTQASSVEAFGIKLNVTHPSLILVLAGVGLMLAPRLLPEAPDKTGKQEAVVAEAAKPQTPAVPAGPAPVAAPTIQPGPTPSSTQAAVAPAASPTTKPTEAPPAVPPSAATARPTRIAKPPTPAPALSKRREARSATSHPAVKPATTAPIAAAPSATTPAAETAIPPPATAAKPARPTLVYAALGLPTSRSFWSGETRASYTRRMQSSLQQAGQEVLRMNTRELDLSQKEFDAWWNESGQHPRSRELCAASHAPLALLAARVETPATISSIESAYWPELKLRLFTCANQRLYRQQKTLSPQNDDAWPFANELNSEIERLLRTYRSDLTD